MIIIVVILVKKDKQILKIIAILFFKKDKKNYKIIEIFNHKIVK